MDLLFLVSMLYPVEASSFALAVQCMLNSIDKNFSPLNFLVNFEEYVANFRWEKIDDLFLF